MKKFVFLLVCLVFSSSIIGMARAAENEDENPEVEATTKAGEEPTTKVDAENNTKNETTGETVEKPDGGDQDNVDNKTPNNATESVIVETNDEKDNKTETADPTTDDGNNGSGSVLPSLFVVMATAIAGYNFAC